MSDFTRITSAMCSSKIKYGHIQKNKKNIQTLESAKKEIEKALFLKENIKNGNK